MPATQTSCLPCMLPEIPADDFADPYAKYEEAELWTTYAE